ncbi:MAG: hypothetical protein U5L45_02965 [Saprospiraceae bacterium]|nr:hypothetical protein [Saprospiraceae bacterium]
MAKSSIKSFQYWSEQDVRLMFNLTKLSVSPHLTNLLHAAIELTDGEKKRLDKYRFRLLEMANAWSEEDLKMYFIAHVLDMADIGDTDKNYRFFFDQTIKGTVKGEIIGGSVDALLAKGYQTPLAPFFFLKEYKAEKRRDTDPLGQLLAAMIVAENHNDHGELMYGCYVIGRLWFFITFQNSSYSISRAYDATQEDIYEILVILRRIKILFENKINIAA